MRLLLGKTIQGNETRFAGGLWFKIGISNGITEKETFKKRPAGSEGTSWMGVWGTMFLLESVDQVGCWHQVNANRNSQFWVLWKQELYAEQTAQLWYLMVVRTVWLGNSSVVLQLNYKAVQLWKSMAVRRRSGETPLQVGSSALLWLAPLGPVGSALPCSAPAYFAPVRHLQCFSSTWGKSVFHL